MLFDADGRIRRFGSPEEVIEAFAPLRLEFYHKRKAHLLQVRLTLHAPASLCTVCEGCAS